MHGLKPAFRSFSAFANYARSQRLGEKDSIVIFSRHCTSRFNQERRIQSWAHTNDDVLTPKGHGESKCIAGPAGRLPVKAFMSSDSIRAVQSIMPSAHGHEVHLFPFLRSFDFGSLGGLTYGFSGNEFEDRFPSLYDVWKTDRRNFVAPGGEKYRSFAERLETGFFGRVLENSSGGISFVMTHKACIKHLLFCTMFPAADLSSAVIDIASLSAVGFAGNEPAELLLFNNAEHLNS